MPATGGEGKVRAVSRSVVPADDDEDRTVWRARPTVREVVRDLLTTLVIFGAFVLLLGLVPGAHGWSAWASMAVPVLGAGRNIVTAVRGRVVLTRDGIEVRRVLTRHYPWASLRSITVEDDGRIEITPQGWVRKLPIPPDEVPGAFAAITRWRQEHERLEVDPSRSVQGGP